MDARPTPPMLARMALLAVAAAAVACGGGGGAGPSLGGPDEGAPGPDLEAVAEDDADAADAGPADAPPPPADADGADAADAGPVADAPPGPPWVLPACDRACDRVTDCGVDACVGWDWASAGQLFLACHATCDGGFEEDVLAAPACAGVTALAEARLADYAALCASNPCQLACETLGACVVEVCPAFGPPSDEQIADDCAADCQPEDVAWVLGLATCEALIGAIAGADAGFAAACYAQAPDCPPPEPCAAYAAKLTGCVLAHCGAPVAPWAAGLEPLLAQACATDAECPSQAFVDHVLADATTCDSPTLAQVGPAPPFTAFCDGTLPVGHDDAVAACAKVMACPGTEGLLSAEVCAVLLALRGDAAQATACLLQSEGCPALFACLSEP